MPNRNVPGSFAVAVLLAGGLFACRAPERVMVGRHSVDPTTYRAATSTVEQQFAKATTCPQAQQSVTIFSTDKEEVTELGVSGCDQKRVYLRLKEKESSWGNVRHWSANWILKTTSTGAPAEI